MKPTNDNKNTDNTKELDITTRIYIKQRALKRAKDYLNGDCNYGYRKWK